MSQDFQNTLPVEYGGLPNETPPTQRTRHRLAFHGSGGEYFRIWLVNLGLSVISLGIYSPWAKVRAQRYFHANTELDGTRFEYHATPRSILLGRGLLALIFIAGVVLAQTANPLALLVIFAGLVLLPWLMASSMRFNARMVSWRGVRFAWQGSTASVYLRWLKVALLTTITFGIYYFAGHHSFKRLLVDKLQFGDQEFECQSTAGSFYSPYILFGLTTSFGSKLVEVMGHALSKIWNAGFVEVAISGLSIGLLYVAYQVLACTLSKIVQNQTKLASLQLVNDAEFTDLVRLYTTNFIYTALTLGLYWPWARIRAMQYRATHLEVVGDLQSMQSHNIASQQTGAFGQEAAGAMDFNVSF
jgi:uncharacterized membrane protein YjgN (DUF898 family)